MTSVRKYTVFPGQFIITSVPSFISTVLGSCVSVVLWDKHQGIGGLNHYLLPGGLEDGVGDARRGRSATRMLIHSMLNRGVHVSSLEAKVFGGCNSLYRQNNIFKIGERNVDAAYEVLEAFHIPIVAQHVGGGYGRKIVFNTATGKVRMRLLNKTGPEVNEAIDKGFGY